MADEQVPPEPEPDAPASDDKQSLWPAAPTMLGSAAALVTLVALIAGGSACGDVLLGIAIVLPLAAAFLAGGAVFLKLQGRSDAWAAIGFTVVAVAVGLAGYAFLAASIDAHYCA